MPLGSNELRTVQDHLSGHSVTCPICHATSWGIQPDFVALGYVDLEYKRMIEGKVHPVVIMVCNDCGYLLTFSAEKLGFS